MVNRTSTRSVKTALLSLLLIFILALAACGSRESAPSGARLPSPSESAPASPSASPSESPSPSPKEPVKVKQVTNWFAEPEHGGQYAALVKGFYEEAGLDMTLQPGGPGVSSTQIVASGQAEFGMGQADEILLARQNGIPIVAIAATFQKNPQGIMFHKGKFKDPSELNGHKVYVASGSTYWEFLKKIYKLDNVQELKYTGSLANFVSDPDAATQIYVTAEPFAMKEQNVEVDYFLNYDLGYKQYGNVLYTTEDYIKEHPDIVKAYVEASIKGWNYYKDNSEEINKFIQEKNPDMSLEAMAFGAETQKPLVYEGDAAVHGVGYMNPEIWSSLQKQLLDLGILKSEEPVEKAFTNEFLPAP